MTPTLVSHWNKTALDNDSKRVRLFYHDNPTHWGALENLRDDILENEGQYISLNLGEPIPESLPEMFYDALKNTRWDQTLQFSLPSILQHNPRAPHAFINRAILWQRLCDLLVIDDEPYRETVLVLENVDQASPETQHDVARLIRFHETHSIERTFIFTFSRNAG